MYTQVRDYALRINLIKDGTIATVNFGERSRLMDIDGGYWDVSEVCEGELLLTKHNWHRHHDGRVKGSGTGSKKVLQFSKSETLAVLNKYIGEYGILHTAADFYADTPSTKYFKVKLSERSNFTNMYSKHVTTVTEKKPVIVEESKRYVEDKDKIEKLYEKFPDEAKRVSLTNYPPTGRIETPKEETIKEPEKVDILPVKADDELEALKQLMNEKIYKYEADIRTINDQIEELMGKLHEAEDNHLALSRALDILNKNDKEVK